AGLLFVSCIRRPPLGWPVVWTHYFHDRRAGGSWQFHRWVRGLLRVCRDHLARRPLLRSGMGLRAGLCVLHPHDVCAPAGAADEALVTARKLIIGVIALT